MPEGERLAPGFFDRLVGLDGRNARRSPEWEMLFPGFTYRLWRISDVDVDTVGFRWAWEAKALKEREIWSAASKGEAESKLRRRIVTDLGPLVAGLGRFVQHERDWCFACGRTLPAPGGTDPEGS